MSSANCRPFCSVSMCDTLNQLTFLSPYFNIKQSLSLSTCLTHKTDLWYTTWSLTENPEWPEQQSALQFNLWSTWVPIWPQVIWPLTYLSPCVTPEVIMMANCRLVPEWRNECPSTNAPRAYMSFVASVTNAWSVTAATRNYRNITFVWWIIFQFLGK